MALLKVIDDTKVIVTIERVVVNKENTVAHLFVGQDMYFEYREGDGEKLQDKLISSFNMLMTGVVPGYEHVGSNRPIKIMIFHEKDSREVRSFITIQCDYAQLSGVSEVDETADAIWVHFGDEMVPGVLQIPKGTDAEAQFRSVEKYFTEKTTPVYGGPIQLQSSVKLTYAADGYTNIVYFVGYVPEVCQ